MAFEAEGGEGPIEAYWDLNGDGVADFVGEGEVDVARPGEFDNGVVRFSDGVQSVERDLHRFVGVGELEVREYFVKILNAQNHQNQHLFLVPRPQKLEPGRLNLAPIVI